MLPRELDAAMAVYLGAERGGGYEPIRKDARLQAAFGTAWRDVKARLDAIPATMMAWDVDWEQWFSGTARAPDPRCRLRLGAAGSGRLGRHGDSAQPMSASDGS
jgi:hypothetical protein